MMKKTNDIWPQTMPFSTPMTFTDRFTGQNAWLAGMDRTRADILKEMESIQSVTRNLQNLRGVSPVILDLVSQIQLKTKRLGGLVSELGGEYATPAAGPVSPPQ